MPSLYLLFVNCKIPILGSKKYSTITISGISQKIHYYKKIYLIKNWSAEFCPLFQEIPLLQDTLLQESTVYAVYQSLLMYINTKISYLFLTEILGSQGAKSLFY